MGLGLIGGSIALRVRATWPGVEVLGVDRPAEAARARARGVVSALAPDLDALASCDLIVLATPGPVIVQLMPQLASIGTPATITDVGSTKRGVMAAARAAGLQRFVGGHPMAGSERGGLEHARAELFERRPWLLMTAAEPSALGTVEAFVRGLGALPQRCDADRHDEVMAYVSHLPQIVAVALTNAAAEAIGPEGLAMAGQAFADMTRLASSPGELWQGILSQNADFVRAAVARFVAALPSEAADLADGWVRDAFARAGAARDRWNNADGPP